MGAEWVQRRIGDFATRKKLINENGDDLPPLSVTKDRGVILQSEKYNKRVATDPRKYVIVEEGDFAFDPMSLYYGALGRVTGIERGLISPDYVSFSADSTVDAGFLEYLLRSQSMIGTYETVAQAGNQFGKRRRVYWSVLQDLSVTVPSLSEQRRIAAILSAVDGAIERGAAVVEQVELVRRRLADDLLSNGYYQRRQRRGGPRDSLPDGWNEQPLSEVATVQTGIAKGKPVPGASVDVAYLRVANVQDGFVDLTEMKTITVEPGALERYSLRGGDVLFTEGGDFDKLGRGCVWRGQISPCLHQNHVFAVRTSEVLLPEFLAAFAGSSRGRVYFLNCSKRTTNLASINSTQLKALPVPIPPLDEQKDIVNALASVVDRLERERAVLSQRRIAKAALAAALLNGDVVVPLPDAGLNQSVA